MVSARAAVRLSGERGIPVGVSPTRGVLGSSPNGILAYTLGKLGCTNRAQVAVWAARHELAAPESTTPWSGAASHE